MSEAPGASVKTMAEAKEIARGSNPAGLTFRTSKGVIGKLLGRKNERGYPLAELDCAEPGCSSKHVRQSCDWHFSSRCEAHARNPTSGAPQRPKLKKILPNDDAETVALKDEFNNRILEQRARVAELRKEAVAKARLRAQVAAMRDAETSVASPGSVVEDATEVGNG